MKQKQLLISNIIGAVLVLSLIITGTIRYSSIINGLFESMHEASAIGIIGGADGPTTIFVSGNFNLYTVLLLVGPFLLLGILLFNVVYFIRNR